MHIASAIPGGRFGSFGKKIRRTIPVYLASVVSVSLSHPVQDRVRPALSTCPQGYLSEGLEISLVVQLQGGHVSQEDLADVEDGILSSSNRESRIGPGVGRDSIRIGDTRS